MQGAEENPVFNCDESLFRPRAARPLAVRPAFPIDWGIAAMDSLSTPPYGKSTELKSNQVFDTWCLRLAVVAVVFGLTFAARLMWVEEYTGQNRWGCVLVRHFVWHAAGTLSNLYRFRFGKS